MNYDEWLESIELLSKTNNVEIKNKLINENYNPNIAERIESKLLELINLKLNKAIKDVISSLEEIMYNSFSLDLAMIDFKKKIMFIYELTDIKQIEEIKKEVIKEKIVRETDSVYEILIRESIVIDPNGVLETTIINNRIKWS